MKEFTCIICPNGCQVSVDDSGNITGNKCPRGVAYVKQESTNPIRTITSTVKVCGGSERVCSVKTEQAIPKGKMFDVMKEINKVNVKAPVKMHDIIIENVCGTGVNVIATKEVK